MDDLYDNLENYNETKEIQELRNENQELKRKMEKYAVTLGKLQKDFDNLAAEYKKLEMNYSSLLKTARAEIERKTQIITNLNLEKDAMVLNAIQNKNILNVRRNRTGGKVGQRNSGAVETDAQNKNQQKSWSSSTGRKEPSQTPSEDTSTAESAENTAKVTPKSEKSAGRVSDAKENVESARGGRPARAAAITSRRKSMPACSFRQAKFSSDEDGEITTPPRKLKDPMTRESDASRNLDRNYGRDHKPPDCDPHGRNRNYDNGKWGKDRFDSQRHRFSPERFLRRSKRDYSGDRRFQRDNSGGYRSEKDGPGDQKAHRDGSGDYRSYRDRLGTYRSDRDGTGDYRGHRDGSGDHRPYRDHSGDRRSYRDSLGDHKPRREEPGDRVQRPEYRKRRLESPSRDKFHQFQQKNHEEFERDYYDERNKYIEDVSKPKYNSDHEEPSHKRLKTDPYHRYDPDNKGHKDKGFDQSPQPACGLQPVLENIQGEDMSCQSPDYLTTELASVPKEIKLDAEVKIDDPREHSNKYTVQTQNGEKVLTTVAGRNVDLKPVNKSMWNIVEVEIPVALVRRPSQCSEDIVNEVYGDIDVDIPASDISSEEGSVIYKISTDPFLYKLPRKENHRKQVKDIVEHEKENEQVEKVVENTNISKKNAAQIDKVVENTKNCENEITHGSNNVDDSQFYENPTIQTEKIKADPQTSEEYTTQTEKQVENTKNSGKGSIQTQKVVEKSADTKETPNISKTKYKIPKLKNKDQSDNKRYENKVEIEKEDSILLKRKSAAKTTIVSVANTKNNSVVGVDKGMVEGDLELSDESSDNIDILKRVMEEIADQTSFELTKPDENNIIIDKVTVECTDAKSIDNNAKVDFAKDKNVKEKTKSESSDNIKKSKGKKKITKQKAAKDVFIIPEKENALGKHTQPKVPEVVVSKEIKTKFSDLFGDSSSLITPEDLGLTAQEVRIESSSSNYFPIFEDAQDAIDLAANKVTNQKRTALPATTVEKTHIVRNKHNENIEEQNIDKDANVKKIKSIKNKDKAKAIDNDKPTDTDRSKVKHKLGNNSEQVQQATHTNDIQAKSCKKTDKEHHNKKPEASETKTLASKALEKPVSKNTDTNETKPKYKLNENAEKERHSFNPLDGNEIKTTVMKNKASKNMQKEINVDTNETKSKAKTDMNTETELHVDVMNLDQTKYNKNTEKLETNDMKPKTIEIKRRKTKICEEKPQLAIDTAEAPQPAVITMENITASHPVSDKPNSDNFTTNEPDVVKTVIISSGVQPTCVKESLPVVNISPILEQPATPNIDSRQTRAGIPLLRHSVQIHALATSTPSKDLEDSSCRTPDISNTSNDQTSISNFDSQNDAPDVRIFVKRRRRVIKKTTPSKT